MMASIHSCNASPAHNPLHAAFLVLLPKLQTHAQIYFRDVKCPVQRDDQVAETVALAWKWFVRLAERGKDVSRFPTVFIAFVARAVKSGRRLCGQEKAKEVLSSRAQQRHGFAVESLPVSTRRDYEDIYSVVRGQQELDAYEERLKDNTVTPPPDAAAFRLDFPKFLGGLSERDRNLAMFLSLNHSAKKAAAKFQVSPGRVTQLRQQWCREWRRLQGEEGDTVRHRANVMEQTRCG
jgi:hypothetical protein